MNTATIEGLAGELATMPSWEERAQRLMAEPGVRDFCQASPDIATFLEKATTRERAALLGVVAVGQGPIVLRMPPDLEDREEKLHRLVEELEYVDRCYAPIGGIVGYHAKVIELLEGKAPGSSLLGARCSAPPGVDLCHREVSEATLKGLEMMPLMAEIYPIGGAGDRLSLVAPETKEPLPAALLPFGGRTLLEGMIRDLQARERLYRKVFGREVVTPIAMMTSHEKNNHTYLTQLLEVHDYFGRPKESFFLFPQGSVPVLTCEGNWSMRAPLEPALKPGGHGVLWKKMEEVGVFSWFEEWGRTKALVRQVNNPIAGVDDALLALIGLGEKKEFGVAACHRRVGAPEGTLVQFERPDGSQGIGNIEYTELEKFGLEDAPVEPGSHYSKFPANTNILFVDLPAVRRTVSTCPFPGLMINMKKLTPFCDAEGCVRQVKGGRLETMMQNIAEYLHPFMTFNRRRKTLSVTKKLWQAQSPIADTPEGAYFDGLHNAYELLHERCALEMPQPGNDEEYLASLHVGERRRPLHFVYHPALGPGFGVIAQKIRGGKVAPGSELHLEVAEVDFEGLELEGSLRVIARQPLGEACCTLHGVRVRNRGLIPATDAIYWKDQVRRGGSLTIILEGNGQFEAHGVTLEGDQTIVVPDGQRLIVTAEGKKKTPISNECPWEYRSESGGIKLSKPHRPL